MNRFILAAVFALLPAIAHAQITPTYTFGLNPPEVISSDKINTNFALLTSALNRTGGTMTGTLTSQQITPAATNTYDLGTTATRFRDLWLSRDATITGNLTVTGTITGTVGNGGVATSVVCTGCIDATQLASTTVTLGAYGSSTAIASFTVDADGRLTAAANVTPQLTLASTYFSSLAATNLTAIPAAQVTGAGLLPDSVHSANIPLINGTNAFTGANTFAGRTQALAGTNVALTCDGATTDQNVAISTYTTVRFTTAGGAACLVGGIAGGVDGRVIFVLNATGQQITFTTEAAGSTAGNRIATPGTGTLVLGSGTMTLFVYDLTTARWRPFRAVV